MRIVISIHVFTTGLQMSTRTKEEHMQNTMTFYALKMTEIRRDQNPQKYPSVSKHTIGFGVSFAHYDMEVLQIS